MCAHACMRACVCVHVCACTCVCLCVCVCAHSSMCVRVHMCMYVCVCMHKNINDIVGVFTWIVNALVSCVCSEMKTNNYSVISCNCKSGPLSSWKACEHRAILKTAAKSLSNRRDILKMEERCDLYLVRNCCRNFCSCLHSADACMMVESRRNRVSMQRAS